MRKLLTIATIAVAALGINATTAAAAGPSPTGSCKTYFSNTDRITKREHQLEVAAAWAGLNVEDYCAANGG